MKLIYDTSKQGIERVSCYDEEGNRVLVGAYKFEFHTVIPETPTLEEHVKVSKWPKTKKMRDVLRQEVIDAERLESEFRPLDIREHFFCLQIVKPYIDSSTARSVLLNLRKYQAGSMVSPYDIRRWCDFDRRVAAEVVGELIIQKLVEYAAVECPECAKSIDMASMLVNVSKGNVYECECGHELSIEAEPCLRVLGNEDKVNQGENDA